MIPEIKIEILDSKTQFPTMKVNDFFLHSKYNPLREAEQFISSQYKDNHVHILFGYGLGYFADALKNVIGENDSLIIIDPLFKEKKISVPNEKFICLDEINEINVEKSVFSLLKDYNRNINVICSPNYDKIFPEEYKIVLKTIKDILRVNTVFFNTINFFAEIWQENYIRNIYNVFQDESLRKLEKMYDLPVVIASGGPSLIKQIPLLTKARNEVLLIAAGSTVNTLLHYNLEADFVISVDGSLINYNHFKDNTFKQSKLIYSIKNHYKIREQFKGEAYSFIPSFEPGTYKHLEKLTNKQLPTLLGGASVANYALTIALFISTGPIAIIGQDLAYTDNKSHAEFNKHFTKINEKFLNERKTFFTEGYNGENVLTDSVFLAMKKSFEKIAQVTDDINRVYNCTEGGVKINGVQQKSFKLFLDSIKSSRKQSENVPLIKNKIHTSQWIKLYEKVEEELKVYDEIIAQLTRGLHYLNKNISLINFSQKTIDGLNQVDEKLKDLVEIVSINSIVEPITIEVLKNFLPKRKESKIEEFKRVFEQNQVLYKKLLKATELSKKYTESLLEQIKNTKVGDI